MKFGRAQFGGPTVTAVGAVLLFFAKQVGWAITLAVLSYPISVVPAFLVYLARDLLGGGKSRWTGEVGLLIPSPKRESDYSSSEITRHGSGRKVSCASFQAGRPGFSGLSALTGKGAGFSWRLPRIDTPGRGEVSRRLAGGDAAGRMAGAGNP